MTFEKALEAMRDGKMVTRTSWPDKNMLWLGDSYGLPATRVSPMNSENSSIWKPTAFDLAADDWEIVEEKPKISFEELPELTIGGGWEKCIVKYRGTRRPAYATIVGDINIGQNITQDEYIALIELRISGGKLES